MLRDVLTEEELHALLSEENTLSTSEDKKDIEETKLIHALVRNQLRLMAIIEEMQAEIRHIKSGMETSRAARETATGLEPLPLPFMKQPSPPANTSGTSENAPAADLSRRERHKRKTLW